MSRVFFPDSRATEIAKLEARVVTPEPPFAPKKTHNLPSGLFDAGVVRMVVRRTAARTMASATAPGVNGSVRNSRAPARMQRIISSESATDEYTITVDWLLAHILSTRSSAASG